MCLETRFIFGKELVIEPYLNEGWCFIPNGCKVHFLSYFTKNPKLTENDKGSRQKKLHILRHWSKRWVGTCFKTLFL